MRPRKKQRDTAAILLLVVFGVAALVLWAPSVVHAQEQDIVTLDSKFHTAGNIEQFVSNAGQFNFRAFSGPATSRQNTEWPAGSLVDYMGDLGIIVGGIPQGGESEGDTLVSIATAFSFGQAPSGGRYEDVFRGYSDAPCDTIWVAGRGDTLDVPYAVPYPGGSIYRPASGLAGTCPMQARSTDTTGYTPVSNQDFVTRYNDYNGFILERTIYHQPLYIDVTQASYAWSSPPLNDFIIARFTVKATRYDIQGAYLGLFVDPNIGFRPSEVLPGDILGDDYSQYLEEYHMGVGRDAEGGQDATHEPYGVIGNMLLMADSTRRSEELEWTWRSGGRGSPALSGNDQSVYQIISAGIADTDQPGGLSGNTHYALTSGPVDIPADSTYTFTMAIVPAENMRALREKAETVRFAVERDFRLPQPPPAPEVSDTVRSGTVHLDWSENRDRVENYTDPNRADTTEQPFEGYRVWKSTQSRTGPWTLLGTYDVEDDTIGANSGLRLNYTDRNLVNNTPYYYAVTAFSKPDPTINWPSQQTSRTASAIEVIPSSGTASSVGEVRVVPNPYRGDIRYQDFNPPWERPPEGRNRWLPQDRRIAFVNLPGRSRIRIYTVSGRLVEELLHQEDGTGFETWDMTSQADLSVSSGIYMFTVKDLDTGEAQSGKFVIIK